MKPDDIAMQKIKACISYIEDILRDHECGLSIGDNGDSVLISHEYLGEDGNNYILTTRAFKASE